MSTKVTEEALSCVSSKLNLGRIALYANFTSLNLAFIGNLSIVEKEITIGTGTKSTFLVLLSTTTYFAVVQLFSRSVMSESL